MATAIAPRIWRFIGLNRSPNPAILPCMSVQGAAGWVIMVGTLPDVRYYDVAIPDKARAMAAVRAAQNLGLEAVVEATAALSQAFVTKFKLLPGVIRRR